MQMLSLPPAKGNWYCKKLGNKKYSYGLDPLLHDLCKLTVISKKNLDFGPPLSFAQLWKGSENCGKDTCAVHKVRKFHCSWKSGKKFDGEEEERKVHCGDQMEREESRSEQMGSYIMKEEGKIIKWGKKDWMWWDKNRDTAE